jgi:hypothetical protein
MPNVSIRNKYEWGFKGFSTIKHDYNLETIRGDVVVVDNATGLMWHQGGSRKYMKWKKAKEWIKKLNKIGYAGYYDWRIPTLEEAVSLLESSKRTKNYYRGSPLNTDPVFDDKQRWIWTGDRPSHLSHYGWGLNFTNGEASYYDDLYVRPVRSVLSKDVDSSYQSGRDTGQVQVIPQQEPSYGDASLSTFTWPDGTKYVGEFKNDKFHGQGTYTWPDGDKYVGEFKDDKFHGQGTKTWPNGEKYVGEWKNDKFHGQGTYTWGSGSEWAGDKYVGEFKNDNRTGQGTYTSANGDKYVGEWKNDNRTGQGTYTWPNGDKYVGEWKDDIATGGWLYRADGSKEWSYQDSAGNWNE